MFYFGGMTLGYLEPPARNSGGKNGENAAEPGQREASSLQAELAVSGRGLLGRITWFASQG